MKMSRIGGAAVAALLGLASLGAKATLVDDLATGFYSAVPDRGLESLNGYRSSDGGPLDLAFVQEGGTFAGFTATLTASSTGGATSRADSGNNGRFFPEAFPNTFWDDGGEGFTIEFDTAISAFGFDWADVGDFNGSNDGQGTGQSNGMVPLIVCLSKVENGDGSDLCHNIAGSTTDGARGFAGLFDSSGMTYKFVRFINNSGGLDGQAFDNFRAGIASVVTTPNPTPEPAGIALLGLGLLALTRRQKSMREVSGV